MARFGSKIVGGYFPTPTEVLPYIANLFEPPKIRGKLLDPFAGNGEALQFLSNAWNMEPYAVEIDEERGKECQKLFGVTNAAIDDYYNMTISNFAFPLVFLNPPYDEDIISQTLYGNRRSEYRAMQQTWKLLQPDGFLCFVCYTQHMTPALFESLASNATMIHIYKFPGLHLDTYQQILIVAQFQKKKTKPTPEWIEEKTKAFIALAAQPDKIRNITEGPIPRKIVITNPDGTTREEMQRGKYQLPTQKTLRRFWFIPRKMDKDALEELNRRFGAHKLADFVSLVKPVDKPAPVVPIAPPRYGQLSVIMAAGLFNGIKITHEGKKAILRGSVQRLNVKVKTEVDEDAHGHERVTETFHDKPVSAIIILSEDGTVFNITEHEKLVTFISEHREELLEYFDKNYKPAYDMTINEFWGETYDNYKVRGEYPMLPTQEQVTTAMTEHLLRNDYGILVGEMATGKTAMTISIIANMVRAHKALKANRSQLGFMAERYGKSKLSGIQPGKPVMILCPATLPLQWQEEINLMYPEAETRLLKVVADARQLFEDAKANPDKLYVGIVSYEAAKLGEGWKGASFVHRHYSKEKSRDKDGNLITNIAIDKYAFEPVTGSPFMEKKNRNAPYKNASPERMDAKMFFYEGRIFDGYEESFDSSGNKMKRPKFVHVVNRRVTEAEIAQGYRQLALPMFSQTRRFGLPKTGNGYANFDIVDITIPSKRIWKYKSAYKFGEPTIIAYAYKDPNNEQWFPIDTKERVIQGKQFTGWISGEPIEDRWLAMQGVKCTTNSKSKDAIDRRMSELRKKSYKVGGGDAELDKMLRKIGVSTYYLGLGEVVPRPARYPIAEYIAKHWKGQISLLIVDELHRTKGIDTDRGVASRILIQAAKKVLGLTGTIYGGVASSIYAIEFSFNKRVQKRFPWVNSFPMHWIGVMGTIEEQWRKQASYSNGVYTGTKRTQTVEGKEAPGCSPLLVKELMDHCVFVGLRDLGGVMPDFAEIPEEVHMDELMLSVYTPSVKAMQEYNKKCLIGGDGSFTGSMYQNILRMSDAMHRPNEVHHRPRLDKWDTKSKREDKVVMTIPSIGEYIKPKEQRLVDLVKAKVQAGKKVIVFLSQTGTRDIQDRIQDIIKAGIPEAKPFILRNVDTLNRVRWIQKQVDAGGNVMISNPGLVTEGVNLIMFSSTIYIEIEPSLTVMSQSSRRTWRMSQQEASVDVQYLYYGDNLYQSMLLYAIADKTAAANVLYGNEGGSLSSLSETVEVFDDLTKIVENAKLISREEIAAKFNASAYNASEDFVQSSWFAPFRREPEYYFGKKRKAEDFIEPIDEDDDGNGGSYEEKSRERNVAEALSGESFDFTDFSEQF